MNRSSGAGSSAVSLSAGTAINSFRFLTSTDRLDPPVSGIIPRLLAGLTRRKRPRKARPLVRFEVMDGRIQVEYGATALIAVALLPPREMPHDLEVSLTRLQNTGRCLYRSQ